MEKELLAFLLPLLALVIKYLIQTKLDRKESLEDVLKKQRIQDEASTSMLTDQLQDRRNTLSQVQDLQEVMEQDLGLTHQDGEFKNDSR